MKRMMVLASVAVLASRSACGYAETRLRVLTYNIHHAEGLDGRVDLDRIAAVIAEARADIVCLQEVDRGLSRSGRADFPTLLAAKLNMQVVFEPNLRFDGGEYGNATLTRLSVESARNIPLPCHGETEARGCLLTTLRTPAGSVDVFNTHLGLDPDERKEQAAALLSHLRALPAILAGDLNEAADGPTLQTLLARFSDTGVAAQPLDRPETTPAATYPADRPKHRIDYVLVSGPLDILSSGVLSTSYTAQASDHRPYAADMRLRHPREQPVDKGVYDTDDERVNEAITEGR